MMKRKNRHKSWNLLSHPQVGMMDDDYFRKLACVCMCKENLVNLMWGCDEKQELVIIKMLVL